MEFTECRVQIAELVFLLPAKLIIIITGTSNCFFLLFLGRRVWQYISEIKRNSDEQVHQKINVNVFCESDSLGQNPFHHSLRNK